VSHSYPCGFCGGSSCRINIKSGKADSDCRSAYPFLISAAVKFLASRPCTNVPIRCSLGCDEVHWKYNFEQHLRQRHPSWKQIAPQDLLEKICVSEAEQRALGVPE
ncbi:hypothetical protein B0H13DRAFT_1463987, partial [Mycena leptocephala]